MSTFFVAFAAEAGAAPPPPEVAQAEPPLSTSRRPRPSLRSGSRDHQMGHGSGALWHSILSGLEEGHATGKNSATSGAGLRPDKLDGVHAPFTVASSGVHVPADAARAPMVGGSGRRGPPRFAPEAGPVLAAFEAKLLQAPGTHAHFPPRSSTAQPAASEPGATTQFVSRTFSEPMIVKDAIEAGGVPEE